MTKDEFTDLVGIEYADEYEKAQLSQEGTTKDATSSTANSTNSTACTTPPTHETRSNALKALDCVERQAAIEALQKCRKHCIDPFDSYHIDINDAECRLSEVPPAQQERKWIPASERLPEESGLYVITAYDGVASRTTFAKYQKKLKSWELTGARAYWRVLAWMPLPEPYKETET